MFRYPELLPHLAQNPIQGIINKFHSDYSRLGHHRALYVFYTSLLYYVVTIPDDDETRKLEFVLGEMSLGIKSNNYDMLVFEHLTELILKNEDERHIVGIAVNLAETLSSGPTLPQGTLRSTSPPVHSGETINRNIAEVTGFNKNASCLTLALENEIHGNVMTDFDNFWEMFFLNKT
ncbi:BgtAc-31323 [Blumeria graminis f. sp. tritici]|uniref:BgtAc-31323 n=2 Tax=Blumeria graminis f. sp. tritici TaxID=62690 RepID=A0A9X9QDW9_BLUGR|nr:hypothetical protein BGT96224_Ac31323 [Blumeria graminis f. sp. tritici 96224]VDB89906.1 BgtAc-31323 [Blumeria graminis f. sp. tritici]